MRKEKYKADGLKGGNKRRLGIGFFQQRGPILIARLRLDEHESVVDDGQAVVHQHFDPFRAPPEAKMEHAGVLELVGEALVGGHGAIEETAVLVQRRQTRYQRRLAILSGDHVESTAVVDDESRFARQFLYNLYTVDTHARTHA